MYWYGVVVLFDNMWGMLLYFCLFLYGVDVLIYVVIKYIVGYLDVLMGVILMIEVFVLMVMCFYW